MWQRVFHVLEVCKVIGAHKQALANHACVRSSLKAMSASVHEAEVLLNAAPTAIDPDDVLGRRTCIPDDDPRVECIGERHSLIHNISRRLCRQLNARTFFTGRFDSLLLLGKIFSFSPPATEVGPLIGGWI